MKLCSRLVAVALAFGLAQVPAQASVDYFTGPDTSTIPGLTGFATTGAMMDGLAVTATFSGGLSQTRLWADTGATSGGVTGDGWGLSLTGDTFTAPWNFTIDPAAQLGQLNRLVLDGLNALTVFDRTFGGVEGTPGSALGNDFVCTGAGANPCADPDTVIAVYNFQVNIQGNAAVGDLWQTLTLTFLDAQEQPGGPLTNWSFLQDTDNDSRLTQVPEPGSLVLVALALGAAGWISRRRNAR